MIILQKGRCESVEVESCRLNANLLQCVVDGEGHLLLDIDRG